MNKNVLLNTVKKRLNKTQSMRKTLVAQNKSNLFIVFSPLTVKQPCVQLNVFQINDDLYNKTMGFL